MLWTGLLAGGWKPSSTLDHQSTRGNALGSHTTNAVFVITHWVAAAGSSVTRSPWRPRTVADGTSSAVPCWLWVGETRSHRGRDPHHWTAAAACHGQCTGNLLAYLLHWQSSVSSSWETLGSVPTGMWLLFDWLVLFGFVLCTAVLYMILYGSLVLLCHCSVSVFLTFTSSHSWQFIVSFYHPWLRLFFTPRPKPSFFTILPTTSC